MSNRCERCGGGPPVEGETYRYHWPCGCAVTPHVTTEPIGFPPEWVYLATGHGACGAWHTGDGWSAHTPESLMHTVRRRLDEERRPAS